MKSFIAAEKKNIAEILSMMEEFYSLEHIDFNHDAAAKGLSLLIGNRDLGEVLLIREDESTAGYMVLTFGFSLEFEGKFILLDELYIKEEFRGKGIGKAALNFAWEFCRDKGIKAIRLEASRHNTAAQRLYRSSGYLDQERDLLTRWSG